MIEYRVRRMDGTGTGGMEKVINEMARDGWRLGHVSSAAAGVLTVYTFLFFERETAAEQNEPGSRQTAATAAG